MYVPLEIYILAVVRALSYANALTSVVHTMYIVLLFHDESVAWC